MSLIRRLAGLLRRVDNRSLRILLSLGVVVGVGATGTFAAWTDTASVQGTSITAGTIDLKLTAGSSSNVDDVNGYTSLVISNMVPGNSVAGLITVKNNGTAPLKYYLDATGTNPDTKNLVGALQAKVTADTSITGTSPSATCSGTALVGAATAFGTNFLYSQASPHLLAAGATENLCVQATLLSTAASTLQGATTTITFKFTGSSF
jgi:predicted ribosomally synthesized peptide with SipW-like signal peptide